jgi:hypothetical protein
VLTLRNLDAETRKHMLNELERDIADGRVFISPRLRLGCESDYERCLRTAILSGDPASMSLEIRTARLLKEAEERRLRDGRGVITAKVPTNAADVLAEGEFNRYYIRALCCRALDLGANTVIVYRAKFADNPRPESEARVGQRIDAAELLADLRTHMGDDQPLLGIPSGPNSGLSVHLP